MTPENNELRMLANTTKRMSERATKAYEHLRKLTATTDEEAIMLHNARLQVASVKEAAEILNDLYGPYAEPEGEENMLLPGRMAGEPSLWQRIWRGLK